MTLTKMKDESKATDFRAPAPSKATTSHRKGGLQATTVSKQLAQARADGGLEYLAGDRMITVVVNNTVYYKAAVRDLSEKINEAMSDKRPSRRLTGLIVVPKGRSLPLDTLNEQVKSLARKRILIRTSSLDDTLAGAKKIKEEILKHYATASKHAAYLRTKQPASTQ